jgi:hypothetical protein
VRWIVDEHLAPLVLADPAEPPHVAASLPLPVCLQGVWAVARHPSHGDVARAQPLFVRAEPGARIAHLFDLPRSEGGQPGQIRVSTVTAWRVTLRNSGVARPRLTGGVRPMPRRRRRSRAGRVSFGSSALVIVSVLLASRRAWPALVIFSIFVLVLWVAFFRPTQCDVETRDGEGCGNRARGRLRACHLTKHKRAKHDALWRTFSLRNPAIRYRIMWAHPRTGYGRETPRIDESKPRLMHPVYDGAMLAATVVGSVATVLALALQARSI